jgi:hypothetical protein
MLLVHDDDGQGGQRREYRQTRTHYELCLSGSGP